MSLLFRPMQPADVGECVEIVATHPVIGPSYGPAIHDLEAAWLHLLGREAVHSAIWELPPGSQHRIGFVGFSVCVSDDFIREMKTPPLFWFGPELAKRVLQGNSPVLSDKQVGEANSSGGLNLVAWIGCFRPEFEKHQEAYREMINAFINAHRGYFWKEVIAAQFESAERLEWAIQTGGFLWDPEDGRYAASLQRDLHKIVSEPHIVGVTRDLEYQGRGSWVGTLFSYTPPIFGLSRGEQRFLTAALDGPTDEELGERLHLALPTIKKTWRSIYGRVDDCLPQLFPGQCCDRGPQRGKEKRRRALAYIREHPEELRPVRRKLLKSL